LFSASIAFSHATSIVFRAIILIMLKRLAPAIPTLLAAVNKHKAAFGFLTCPARLSIVAESDGCAAFLLNSSSFVMTSVCVSADRPGDNLVDPQYQA
jgi:hypothetical protein